jgi:hypothetical protein
VMGNTTSYNHESVCDAIVSVSADVTLL